MIIDVNENNYNIEIGTSIDDNLIKYLKKDDKRKLAIITDSNVYEIYKNKIENIFNNFNYFIYVIEPGENSKSFENYKDILEFLYANNFTRSDVVVAYGGGVVGDLSGFVSSSYLRGLDFISVPTTLLSMVDSSIGGKNGINFCEMKNQIGTFYFPKHVHIDLDFLNTLDKRNINNGLAEMFKYSILDDENLFHELDQEFKNIDIKNAVYKSLQIKLKFVREDERDNGKRQHLNLGHTLAHAIEADSDYNINHGEAVGIGIIKMARIYYKLMNSDRDISKDIVNAFIKHGLPIDYEIDLDKALNYIKHDKKVRGDYINIILPTSIGNTISKKIRIDNLKDYLELGMN